MADPPAEEQRFEFGFEEPTPDDEADESADSVVAPADDLQQRVAAVHAAAERRSSRRRVRGESWMDALFGPEEEEAPRSGADERDDASSPTAEIAAAETAERREEESLTVAEFYRRVRRALAGEFTDEVWVTGEIRGLKMSRGHRYFELADHGGGDSGRPPPQLEVTCWARDWPPVEAALEAAGLDLEVGRVVRVKGRVSIWDVGGRLRFTLTALDVEAMLGNIAAARRQLLRALEAEGRLEANRRLAVPLVPLRIGVVTSPGSEAYRDFVGRLDRSGFAFVVHLEPSLVQGTDAPAQLALALKRLEAFGPDLAVLVRGGGARGDLAAFDSEELARAIVNAPFPVWSGVGHTGDRSVADEVVNFSTTTPTACGEAIVERVASYYDELRRKVSRLASLARARLDNVAGRLSGRADALGAAARRQLEHREREVGVARVTLGRAAERELVAEGAAVATKARRLSGTVSRRLTTDLNDLERCRQVLAAYDPKRQLQRGWSLTHGPHGRLVRSVRDVGAGEELTTRVGDGSLRSVVASTEANEAEGR